MSAVPRSGPWAADQLETRLRAWNGGAEVASGGLDVGEGAAAAQDVGVVLGLLEAADGLGVARLRRRRDRRASSGPGRTGRLPRHDRADRRHEHDRGPDWRGRSFRGVAGEQGQSGTEHRHLRRQPSELGLVNDDPVGRCIGRARVNARPVEQRLDAVEPAARHQCPDPPDGQHGAVREDLVRERVEPRPQRRLLSASGASPEPPAR